MMGKEVGIHLVHCLNVHVGTITHLLLLLIRVNAVSDDRSEDTYAFLMRGRRFKYEHTTLDYFYD